MKFEFNPFKEIFNQLSIINEKIESLHQKRETHQTEKPIGISEASLILGKSERTIYNTKSKIPHYKNGGKLYFFESELLKLIKEGKIKTETELFKEVNQNLGNLKDRVQASRKRTKNTELSLSERIKNTTRSAEELGENIEIATKEALDFHSERNLQELNEDITEEIQEPLKRNNTLKSSKE